MEAVPEKEDGNSTSVPQGSPTGDSSSNLPSPAPGSPSASATADGTASVVFCGHVYGQPLAARDRLGRRSYEIVLTHNVRIRELWVVREGSLGPNGKVRGETTPGEFDLEAWGSEDASVDANGAVKQRCRFRQLTGKVRYSSQGAWRFAMRSEALFVTNHVIIRSGCHRMTICLIGDVLSLVPTQSRQQEDRVPARLKRKRTSSRTRSHSHSRSPSAKRTRSRSPGQLSADEHSRSGSHGPSDPKTSSLPDKAGGAHRAEPTEPQQEGTKHDRGDRKESRGRSADAPRGRSSDRRSQPAPPHAPPSSNPPSNPPPPSKAIEGDAGPAAMDVAEDSPAAPAQQQSTGIQPPSNESSDPPPAKTSKASRTSSAMALFNREILSQVLLDPALPTSFALLESVSLTGSPAPQTQDQATMVSDLAREVGTAAGGDIPSVAELSLLRQCLEALQSTSTVHSRHAHHWSLAAKGDFPALFPDLCRLIFATIDASPDYYTLKTALQLLRETSLLTPFSACLARDHWNTLYCLLVGGVGTSHPLASKIPPGGSSWLTDTVLGCIVRAVNNPSAMEGFLTPTFEWASQDGSTDVSQYSGYQIVLQILTAPGTAARTTRQAKQILSRAAVFHACKDLSNAVKEHTVEAHSEDANSSSAKRRRLDGLGGSASGQASQTSPIQLSSAGVDAVTLVLRWTFRLLQQQAHTFAGDHVSHSSRTALLPAAPSPDFMSAAYTPLCLPSPSAVDADDMETQSMLSSETNIVWFRHALSHPHLPAYASHFLHHFGVVPTLVALWQGFEARRDSCSVLHFEICKWFLLLAGSIHGLRLLGTESQTLYDWLSALAVPSCLAADGEQVGIHFRSDEATLSWCFEYPEHLTARMLGAAITRQLRAMCLVNALSSFPVSSGPHLAALHLLQLSTLSDAGAESASFAMHHLNGSSTLLRLATSSVSTLALVAPDPGAEEKVPSSDELSDQSQSAAALRVSIPPPSQSTQASDVAVTAFSQSAVSLLEVQLEGPYGGVDTLQLPSALIEVLRKLASPAKGGKKNKHFHAQVARALALVEPALTLQAKGVAALCTQVTHLVDFLPVLVAESKTGISGNSVNPSSSPRVSGAKAPANDSTGSAQRYYSNASLSAMRAALDLLISLATPVDAPSVLSADTTNTRPAVTAVDLTVRNEAYSVKGRWPLGLGKSKLQSIALLEHIFSTGMLQSLLRILTSTAKYCVTSGRDYDAGGEAAGHVLCLTARLMDSAMLLLRMVLARIETCVGSRYHNTPVLQAIVAVHRAVCAHPGLAQAYHQPCDIGDVLAIRHREGGVPTGPSDHLRRLRTSIAGCLSFVVSCSLAAAPDPYADFGLAAGLGQDQNLAAEMKMDGSGFLLRSLSVEHLPKHVQRQALDTSALVSALLQLPVQHYGSLQLLGDLLPPVPNQPQPSRWSSSWLGDRRAVPADSCSALRALWSKLWSFLAASNQLGFLSAMTRSSSPDLHRALCRVVSRVCALDSKLAAAVLEPLVDLTRAQLYTVLRRKSADDAAGSNTSKKPADRSAGRRSPKSSPAGVPEGKPRPHGEPDSHLLKLFALLRQLLHFPHCKWVLNDLGLPSALKPLFAVALFLPGQTKPGAASTVTSVAVSSPWVNRRVRTWQLLALDVVRQCCDLQHPSNPFPLLLADATLSAVPSSVPALAAAAAVARAHLLDSKEPAAMDVDEQPENKSCAERVREVYLQHATDSSPSQHELKLLTPSLVDLLSVPSQSLVLAALRAVLTLVANPFTCHGMLFWAREDPSTAQTSSGSNSPFSAFSLGPSGETAAALAGDSTRSVLMGGALPHPPLFMLLCRLQVVLSHGTWINNGMRAVTSAQAGAADTESVPSATMLQAFTDDCLFSELLTYACVFIKNICLAPPVSVSTRVVVLSSAPVRKRQRDGAPDEESRLVCSAEVVGRVKSCLAWTSGEEAKHPLMVLKTLLGRLHGHAGTDANSTAAADVPALLELIDVVTGLLTSTEVSSTDGHHAPRPLPAMAQRELGERFDQDIPAAIAKLHNSSPEELASALSALPGFFSMPLTLNQKLGHNNLGSHVGVVPLEVSEGPFSASEDPIEDLVKKRLPPPKPKPKSVTLPPGARGPRQRQQFNKRQKDVFRSRKPNSGRAPSMHVDDYVALSATGKVQPGQAVSTELAKPDAKTGAAGSTAPATAAKPAHLSGAPGANTAASGMRSAPTTPTRPQRGPRPAPATAPSHHRSGTANWPAPPARPMDRDRRSRDRDRDRGLDRDRDRDRLRPRPPGPPPPHGDLPMPRSLRDRDPRDMHFRGPRDDVRGPRDDMRGPRDDIRGPRDDMRGPRDRPPRDRPPGQGGRFPPDFRGPAHGGRPNSRGPPGPPRGLPGPGRGPGGPRGFGPAPPHRDQPRRDSRRRSGPGGWQ